MTGTIKNYLIEKQYGFIKGDDGKDYFFHKSSMVDASAEIIDGALVEFDPGVTPKGYKATKIVVMSQSDTDSFVTPDSMILSKKNTVDGWEILEECDWVVTASGRGDPKLVKEEVKQMVRSVGGNGATYLCYSTTTGSEGNHNFTIHHYTARPVLLGRRNLSGPYTRDNLPYINKIARAYKDRCENEYNEARGQYKKRLWVGVAISLGLVVFLQVVGAGVGVVLMILIAAVGRPEEEGRWLWRN